MASVFLCYLVVVLVVVLLKYAQDLDIRQYELRTCPLSKSLHSKKLCKQTEDDTFKTEKRGFKDAYIMIPETKTCYDWKTWKSFGRGFYSDSLVYGPRHAFIIIKETNRCYDWGKWAYARTISCSDSDIKCCFQNSVVEFRGTTFCDHRIEEFHKEWEDQGKYYNILRRNCQTYAISLQKFLEECPPKAASSIEVSQPQSAVLEQFYIRRPNESVDETELCSRDFTALEKYLKELNTVDGQEIEICQANITTESYFKERVCLVLN